MCPTERDRRSFRSCPSAAAPRLPVRRYRWRYSTRDRSAAARYRLDPACPSCGHARSTRRRKPSHRPMSHSPSVASDPSQNPASSSRASSPRQRPRLSSPRVSQTLKRTVLPAVGPLAIGTGTNFMPSEFTSRSLSSVSNSTWGPVQRVVAAPARMLEEVAGELLLERALVASSGFGPGSRGRPCTRSARTPARTRSLVGVRCLRQAASELDRLHLGAEGAAEHPLDEAFDATLEVT